MASQSFVGNGHDVAVSTRHAKGGFSIFIVLKQLLNHQPGHARNALTGKNAANLPRLAVIGSLAA